MLRSQLLRTVRSVHVTPCSQRTLLRQFATGANPTGNTNKSGTQGTGANNEGAGLGTGPRQSTYQNSNVKGQPLNPSANQGQHATKHSQTANVSGQQQKPLPSAGTPDAVGASPKGSEQSINAETKPHHNKHPNARNAGNHTTNKSGTQGTGANNEGAGLGTGSRQSTNENSDVKGQPLNPSVNQGQHATKHSQTANVSGQQQKPSPSAGTPDAVGASPKGSEQSINAETKPQHNMQSNAGNHNQASHSQSSHNASHSNHKDTSHQSHSTNKVSHSQESPASSSSDQHASSSVGTMDLANASAKAKEKAQDIKNKVQNMIQEAGHELPEGNSFIFMGSAVLAAVIFMMVNPDYRYLKHVYKVDEKPRIEAIQHPTLH